MAFTKHYIDNVNKTGLHPKIGVLEALAAPTCKTCNNLADSVTTLVSSKQHYSAEVEIIRSAHRVTGEPGMVIEVLVDQPEISVLNQNGSTSRSVPSTINSGLVFFLDWTKAGWRVHEIKIDNSQAS
ncbi:hypothetical protein [Leekyejoonella antrihumi]|uniref:hypothetical protein n=1 Tax=Leekyejoonella antrihumi TaxID=1660198 RepID=UPI003CCC8940